MAKEEKKKVTTEKEITKKKSYSKKKAKKNILNGVAYVQSTSTSKFIWELL